MSNGNPPAGANVPKSYLSKQTNLVLSPPGYTPKKYVSRPKVLDWAPEIAKGTGNFADMSGVEVEYGNLN